MCLQYLINVALLFFCINIHYYFVEQFIEINNSVF